MCVNDTSERTVRRNTSKDDTLCVVIALCLTTSVGTLTRHAIWWSNHTTHTSV